MNLYESIKSGNLVEGNPDLGYIAEYFPTLKAAKEFASNYYREGKFDKITEEGNEFAVHVFYQPKTNTDLPTEEDVEAFLKEEEKPFLRNKATGKTFTKSEVEDKYKEQYAEELDKAEVPEDEFEYTFEKYLADIDETGEWEFLTEAVALPNLNQILKEINALKVYAEPVEDEEGITIKVLDGTLKMDGSTGDITFDAPWLPVNARNIKFTTMTEFITCLEVLTNLVK